MEEPEASFMVLGTLTPLPDFTNLTLKILNLALMLNAEQSLSRNSEQSPCTQSHKTRKLRKHAG